MTRHAQQANKGISRVQVREFRGNNQSCALLECTRLPSRLFPYILTCDESYRSDGGTRSFDRDALISFGNKADPDSLETLDSTPNYDRVAFMFCMMAFGCQLLHQLVLASRPSPNQELPLVQSPPRFR